MTLEDAKLDLVGDALVLSVGARAWRLPDVIVRHVDTDGAVRFTVERGGRVEFLAEYPRPRPTEDDLRQMELDFLSEEGWDWEDRDFGLFVFATATGVGPVKYRPWRLGGPYAVVLDPAGARRSPFEGCPQEIRWSALESVRTKFHIGSPWAETAYLVLHAPDGVCTVPARSMDEARGWLRRLPGWGVACDEAVDDALAYAADWNAFGDESLDDRCERPVWSRGRVSA